MKNLHFINYPFKLHVSTDTKCHKCILLLTSNWKIVCLLVVKALYLLLLEKKSKCIIYKETIRLWNCAQWSVTPDWLRYTWFKRYSHANWKCTDKWSLTCFKNILKILQSNYLYFAVIYPWKFAIFLKSNLLFNHF